MAFPLANPYFVHKFTFILMKHTHRVYTRIGFLFAATGVMLGAFGSHVLRDHIGEAELHTFDTGVRYQLIHAVAIIALSLAHRKFDEKKLDFALGLLITGVIIFSGSLYLLATRNLWGDDSYRIIGAITPLGGISMIGGWLLLFFKGFVPEDVPNPSEREGGSGEGSDRKRRHHRHRSRRSSEGKSAGDRPE